MDFRSSSGRCAQSRRFAEAHPQVLIIAQARRRGRIDSIAEDFSFRAFCRIRMSTTGRFSLRRRLGTLENTSTDFLHVRIARVRFGNEVCPRPTTTGHVRSKLLVIEPGVVEVTEVAVHSVEEGASRFDRTAGIVRSRGIATAMACLPTPGLSSEIRLCSATISLAARVIPSCCFSIRGTRRSKMFAYIFSVNAAP